MSKEAKQNEIKKVKLTGVIEKGKGNASKNFKKIETLIAERTGFEGPLVSGTLNVMLERHFPIIRVDGVITDTEYNHERECIKLMKCKVEGIPSIIIRPSAHECPAKPEYYNRLEVMSDVHLMNRLDKKEGDRISVEVEIDKSDFGLYGIGQD